MSRSSATCPRTWCPPDTSKVALTASSTVPAQVELQSPLGGIDRFGDLQSAQDGSTVSTATVTEHGQAKLSQGFWFTYVQEIGPFGNGGAPAGETTLTAVATTAGFDKTVTTSTGDPFLASVDPTADAGTPHRRQAARIGRHHRDHHADGQKSAKTVRGILHVVRPPVGVANLFNTTGDILANLPYSYTVS